MTNMKLFLALCLLCSTAYSINMIWIQTAYPECNQCLDQTFGSCPGCYQDISYAQCMCKGDGGVNLATCVSVCDSVDTLGTDLGTQQVSGWYGYCTIFFRDMCADAQPYMSEDSWEEKCGADSASPSAIPSTGEDTPAPTSNSPSMAVSPTRTSTTAKPSGKSALSSPAGIVKSTATSPASGTAANTGTAVSRPTGAAALGSNSLSIWGLIFGLGIQLAGMNV